MKKKVRSDEVLLIQLAPELSSEYLFGTFIHFFIKFRISKFNVKKYSQIAWRSEPNSVRSQPAVQNYSRRTL